MRAYMVGRIEGGEHHLQGGRGRSERTELGLAVAALDGVIEVLKHVVGVARTVPTLLDSGTAAADLLDIVSEAVASEARGKETKQQRWHRAAAVRSAWLRQGWGRAARVPELEEPSEVCLVHSDR